MSVIGKLSLQYVVSSRRYLLELDPLYADVVVQRWENLTGKTTERIVAGST